MKKLFSTILLLGLLLSKSAYANQNIENMLENCADDRFVNKTKINKFTSMLYSTYPNYQELEKKHDSLQEKKKTS